MYLAVAPPRHDPSSPSTALADAIFDGMAEEEDDHRQRLIDLHKKRFGNVIPLIRREHVSGFYARRPVWLMEQLPIEKIRENNRRYTRAWHAPALGNIEVKVEHGKTGGDHMEMRISELKLDAEIVEARPGCAARQSASTDETLRGEG